MTGKAQPRIGLVLKGYPRLSETFIAQEIEGLERRGLAFDIFSLRAPTDKKRHPVHDRIAAPVYYLPEYLSDDWRRVYRAWKNARKLPGFTSAWRLFLTDLRRDPSPHRIRRLGQAAVLATEAAADIVHFHAHFLHSPTSVARYAAAMRGITWSASAHAKDIWTTPHWDLQEKLAEAKFVSVCTRSGLDYLAGIEGKARLTLAYHGVDLEHFKAAGRPQTSGRIKILSVGRAVEKKGYDDLLNALAKLPADIDWQLEHIGGGPLLPRLKQQATDLKIAPRIVWRGSLAQNDVIKAMADADLFALASRVTASNDRDGIPNVLMEAQAAGLPCVSTDLPSIRELIEPDVTGLLVPQNAPEQLSRALERLARDPSLRETIARAAEAKLKQSFSPQHGLDHIEALLRTAANLPPARANENRLLRAHERA